MTTVKDHQRSALCGAVFEPETGAVAADGRGRVAEDFGGHDYPVWSVAPSSLELLLGSGIWGWDGRKVITMMIHGVADMALR